MKNYQVREPRTFASYRVKAIQLLKAYDKFEAEYISKDLRDRIRAIQGKAVSEIKEGDNVAEKLSAEDILTFNDYAREKAEVKDMFLMDNNFANAKLLCDTWFSDYDGEGFETEEDVEQLRKVFADFFQKHRGITAM